jgi:hypothetical protein
VRAERLRCAASLLLALTGVDLGSCREPDEVPLTLELSSCTAFEDLRPCLSALVVEVSKNGRTVSDECLAGDALASSLAGGADVVATDLPDEGAVRVEVRGYGCAGELGDPCAEPPAMEIFSGTADLPATGASPATGVTVPITCEPSCQPCGAPAVCVPTSFEESCLGRRSYSGSCAVDEDCPGDSATCRVPGGLCDYPDGEICAACYSSLPCRAGPCVDGAPLSVGRFCSRYCDPTRAAEFCAPLGLGACELVSDDGWQLELP